MECAGTEHVEEARPKPMDFLRKHLPASAAQYVERCLEGIEFPIRKEELVGRLEANGVPEAVVS